METLNLEQYQEIQKKRKEERIKDNKLIKDIQKNNNFARRNKDKFRDFEPKFFTCSMYEPCAICDKCLNKASHLYVRCQNCQIPICTHKHSDRVFMIRRENFTINVNKEVEERIKNLSKKLLIKE